MNRINICDTLLKRNKIEPFLKRMITGDEKWTSTIIQLEKDRG